MYIFFKNTKDNTVKKENMKNRQRLTILSHHKINSNDKTVQFSKCVHSFIQLTNSVKIILVSNMLNHTSLANTIIHIN